MISINGKTPRLVKINGDVPAVVKINGQTVWEDAFSIDFKANLYWDTTYHSSGCSDWYNEDIRLSGFAVTARHYFERLYLDSIKLRSFYYGSKGNIRDEYEESFEYSDYELKSGQTYNIDQFFYFGETDVNRIVSADFYFYAAGEYKIKRTVSVSAGTDGMDRESYPVLHTVYSDKISAFTEWEITANPANAK